MNVFTILANAIEYIENPDEEMQMKAVKGSAFSIQHIAKPTIEAQLYAVKKN